MRKNSLIISRCSFEDKKIRAHIKDSEIERQRILVRQRFFNCYCVLRRYTKTTCRIWSRWNACMGLSRRISKGQLSFGIHGKLEFRKVVLPILEKESGLNGRRFYSPLPERINREIKNGTWKISIALLSILQKGLKSRRI